MLRQIGFGAIRIICRHIFRKRDSELFLYKSKSNFQVFRS